MYVLLLEHSCPQMLLMLFDRFSGEGKEQKKQPSECEQ